MALITTASADSGSVEFWAVKRGPDGKPIETPGQPPTPLGWVIFDSSQVIPAVITTNTALWTLALTLPRNFAYKLESFHINVTGIDATDFSEWGPAIAATLTATARGIEVLNSRFELLGQSYQVSNASGNRSVAFQTATSGAESNSRFFHPVQMLTDPIEAGEAGSINTRWFNNSGSATGAVTAFWHVRLLMYTIEQMRDYHMYLRYPV